MKQREIKFRVWDKYKKKMISPHDGDFIKWHAMSNWKSILNVMQYTGLKDKNGTEIYEGDILEGSGIVYKVVWHQQGAKYYLEFVKYKDDLKELDIIFDVLENQNLGNGYLKRRDLTVTGNIHENPELTNIKTP